MSGLMTPDHPRWEEFLDRLDAALSMEATASRAQAVAAGQTDEGLRMVTVLPAGCNGKADLQRAHEATRAILFSIGGIDVSRALGFFRLHGGYCDCEILMNVAHRDCGGPPKGCRTCRYQKTIREPWPEERTPAWEEFNRVEREYFASLQET